MRLIQTPVCGEATVAIIVAAVLEGNSGRRPSRGGDFGRSVGRT